MNSTNTLPTLPDVFFHGSAVAFKRIDVTKGRGRKGFGQGFYMAFSAAQAVGMMHKKFRESISRRRDRSGDFCETLYRIEIDVELLKTLRVKTFCSADVEWLNFILMCRPSRGVPHEFDVVIGPTADDDTNMALKYYYDGTYGDPGSEDAKRMLLRVLEVDKLGFQLFVGSQSVADRLVKKLEIVDWREYA
jgi:hypothetical protein